MEKKEFINHFVNDLLALGVRPGNVLVVHPALRPFGYVPGGAETIIQGLLIVLGNEGTLLMPALSWENVTTHNPVFDLQRTPSCVGSIAETFRLRENTKRSLHPTHSVCGLGKITEELLSAHAQDNTPCGPNSPFHQLPMYNGQILMLACGLIYNTSMHAIEELVEPPYLYDPPVVYTLIDENNQAYQKEYIPHNFIGWRQRYDRISEVCPKTCLKVGQVVGTDSYLIEASSLWKVVLRTLRKDPLYFIERTQ